MPPEAMSGMQAGLNAWGGGESSLDGMASIGDPATTPMDPIGEAMDDGPMGGDPTGDVPAFDGVMAAMDGAAATNMAEGMDAANTAAVKDAPADDAHTDDVV